MEVGYLVGDQFSQKEILERRKREKERTMGRLHRITREYQIERAQIRAFINSTNSK